MSEGEGYSRWRARTELVRHTAASMHLGVTRSWAQRAESGPGINDIGYASSSGLSMADIGALMSRAYDVLGAPVARFELSVRPGTEEENGERRVFSATVALTQASHIPTAAIQLPRLFAPTRFRASIVHWELPRVPMVQRLALPFLDEVWTTSTFVREAFAAVTTKPVRVVPLPVPAATGTPGAMRRLLGLRDEYLFAYQFDLASSGERKNPLGVAEAYLRAFPAPRDDVRLLLKAVHAASSPSIWRDLVQAVDGRRDIIVVDDYWPAEAIEAFFVDIDCYVSLHRAEGFGLTLARAMAAGKPVIATGYSGNLDFMSSDVSLLVPSRLVRVGQDPVYPPDGVWAEPDLDFTADALRALADDPEIGRRWGAAASDRILRERTVARTATWLGAHVPGLR